MERRMERRTQHPPRVHVALFTADLERALAFYRAFFGREPARVRPDHAKFEPDDPPLNLTLNLAPAATGGPAAGRGLSHLGVEVFAPGAVEAARERLAAAGLEPVAEPDVVCCYARQEKIWVQDPDGNSWEVFRVTDSDPEDARASACAGSACCPTAGAEADGG